MTRWAKRKLSDESIRLIVARIKLSVKGERLHVFKKLAEEFNCSLSTIYRIQSNALTPSDIDKWKV